MKVQPLLCKQLDPHAAVTSPVGVSSVSTFDLNIIDSWEDSSKHESWNKEENGTERETPILALGICEFHLIIFTPIKRLKFIGSCFLERSANFYSVLSDRVGVIMLSWRVAIRPCPH